MIESTVYSYAAGMVDGDGTIQIMRKKSEGVGSYIIRVSVSTVTEAIPTWFLTNFGGHLYKFMMSKQRRQPIYRWALESKTALPFLLSIEPFLIEKRERAKLAIKYLQTVCPNGFKRLPEDIVKGRTEIFEQMRSMNAKHGRNHWNSLIKS